jgi:hypothetical protein
VPFAPGRDELVTLPDEVREAGTARLSGLMDPRACLALLAAHRSGKLDNEHVDWPVESGGAAAFAQILERLQALSADPHLKRRPPFSTRDGYYLTGCDFVLYRLLAA